MKINLKKVATVLGSALMLGSTAAMAAAASYPAPFVQGGAANVAIVYGSASADSDLTAATMIADGLAADLLEQVATGASGSVVAGDVKVTDDEVTLGGLITGGDIDTNLQDNKLSSLADSKFSWDDGEGSDDYDFHEEVVIGTSKVLTTTDDEELTGVALSNEKATEYRLVMEDALNVSAVGTDDADTLYLTIMGNEYEIEDMTATSITVTTSQQESLMAGEEVTVAGKTVKLTDVYDGSVEVEVDGDSEVISTGNTKRINGIRVNVESVGYHANSPETSKAILKIGEDISKTYVDGDEYIGEDEDDPLWVWTISSLGSANGYVGVKYNADIDSADDDIAGDTIKYVGDGYTFPDNYVAVTLDSITDAEYEDLEFSFEDSANLFNNSDGSTASAEDKPVLVIQAENTDTITVNGEETDKIFVWFNASSDQFETYYRDHDGEYTPTNLMRLADSTAGAVLNVSNGMAQTTVATVEIGDTDLDIDLKVASGVAYVNVTRSDAEVMVLKIGGTSVTNTTAGTLEQLGATDGEAEDGDVSFAGTDVSTKDYDYMDSYGIKLSDGTTVENEADDDMVTLSVPDEQVYAQVTVSMGAQVSDGGDGELGTVTILDTQVASAAGKNLIVVGGSCINTVASELLNGAKCSDSFAAATGIKTGEAIIKSFARGDKIALLVAGYTAADTTKAATYLKNNAVDVTVGKALKVTSATQATALTA